MVLERAELQIRAGMEIDFATAMAERGLVVLRSVPGVESVRMGRGVENPGKFMLLVEWRSLDAHAAFSRLPEFAVFLDIIKPFSTGGSMEHFTFD
ncbi:MAG TPA: antibiotic biosynthesis monooxygenase family protein [Solimonas sp.]